MKRSHVLAAAAVSLAAGPAAAQSIAAKDPQSLAEAMQGVGFQAKLETDSVGDPMIRSAASGSNFVVYFYNCTEHRDCKSIQFYTAYDSEDDAAPSLAKLNEWNTSRRFAVAFLDKDGDPGLSMDVNLDFGGISQKLFQDSLVLWTLQMAAYEKLIGR